MLKIFIAGQGLFRYDLRGQSLCADRLPPWPSGCICFCPQRHFDDDPNSWTPLTRVCLCLCTSPNWGAEYRQKLHGPSGWGYCGRPFFHIGGQSMQLSPCCASCASCNVHGLCINDSGVRALSGSCIHESCVPRLLPGYKMPTASGKTLTNSSCAV